jgi:UPF0755 protein
MSARIVKITAGFAIATVLLAGGLLYLLLRFEQEPASSDATPRVVLLRKGASFDRITAQLHEQGLVRDPLRFKLLARMRGQDKQIRAGEYRLTGTMTAGQLLKTLVQGKVQLHPLTIPEGFNLKQIAAAVAGRGFCTAQRFTQATQDRELMRRLSIDADSFEGYLFPDTYFFPARADAQAIISSMVARLDNVWNPRLEKRSRELGLTRHQILTLASIIEKETGVAYERPIIASVFHNRLRRGMRLQSDPTVIYGIENFDGNITREHLRTPTPYNTYIIKNLPPGPIASPGLASIEAALYPDDTRFLYFVAKRDHTHHFSTNFAAHKRAVRKYQLRK